MEAWVLGHLRERALFLPERRVVAGFLVLATRGGVGWHRLCAHLVTWELLYAQDTAERQSAPFDGIELENYERLGKRLGIGTFSARAAALCLNAHPLPLRRRVLGCLWGERRPMPGPSSEGQRTAAAYRAIRAARSAIGELPCRERE